MTCAPQSPPPSDARPLVSMLLIGYQQAGTVAAAVAGALAQTYEPLEILISDDASADGTFAAMQAAVADYRGPHRVELLRNPVNLGIGAHLSHLAERARGELLFVAAGDDVSEPQRCETVVAAWLAAGRRPDLIASALRDLDAQGRLGGLIQPSDLATYRGPADWLARPPFVVGAAQAWTRRLFDRFGPLPAGVVAEDLVMVLRALMSGGAITLPQPLVRYRRGGLSARRRAYSAAEVVARWLSNNRHALVELPLMLADARRAGQAATLEPALQARLQQAEFIRDLFAGASWRRQLVMALRGPGPPFGQRLRLLVYAAWPGLLAPFFWLKRRLRPPR